MRPTSDPRKEPLRPFTVRVPLSPHTLRENLSNRDSHSSSESLGYVSPTKSIKNFFNNRYSAQSFESISEEPELRPRSAIHSLIRPAFTRSRSSLAEPKQDTSPRKQSTTVDDFADSSDLEYDAESINSILQEYASESKRGSNRHLFTEQFDEAEHIYHTREEPVSPLQLRGPVSGISLEKKESNSPTNPAFSALLQNTPVPGAFTQKQAVPSTDKPAASSISTQKVSVPALPTTSVPATPTESSSSSKSAPETPAGSSVLRATRRPSQRRSIIELTLANHSSSENSLSSYQSFHDAKSDSTGSPAFHIHEDSGSASVRSMELRKTPSVRTPVDRRAVISMSSNVDANRSSIYNLTAVSSVRNSPAEKYPDPDITPKSHAAYDVTDALERPLFDATLRSEIADETVLRSNRSTMRLSMSSGELLLRLESKQHVSGGASSEKDHYSHERARNALADLTAGPDSSTELPVMLYKVQNKDFDEGEQRWLVYEKKAMGPPGKPYMGQPSSSVSRNSSSSSTYSRTSGERTFSRIPESDKVFPRIPTPPERTFPRIPTPTEGKFPRVPTPPERSFSRIPTPPEPSFSRIPTPENRSRKPTPPEISKSRDSSSPSLKAYYSASIVSANHAYFQQNFGDNIGDFRHNKPRHSPNLLPALSQPGPNSYLKDSVSRQTSHDQMLDYVSSSGLADYDLEKHAFHNRSKTYQRQPAQFHSWGVFAAMMALGLVVPPLYFLLSLGVFDQSGNTRGYNGLYYTQEKHNQQVRTKKYRPVQKMVSLAAGIFWFCVILAMIGVGLGLGLGREK